jgi:formylmethanofuran dehydrogenase subunit B
MTVCTCTGCSLLCEDIEIDIETGTINRAKNLCRKGWAHFQALYTERTKPTIDGEGVPLEAAIDKAAEILAKAKKPLLYGWANTSLEAQGAGIELAKKLGATLDDTSSFCEGILMEQVLKGKIPSCTLDDVRNYADTSVFWGADPSNSQPRHLSRFAYYPRGEKRQKSYEEERNCVVVDVRKSATATLCPNYYYRLPPGTDAQFIESIMTALDGKIPKFGDKKRMIELATLLRKTEYGAIFPGIGMILSLQEKMDLLQKLVARLSEITTFKVVPMVENCNERGFNQLLLDKTGFINSVSFHEGAPVHGPEHSVIAAARSCDAALVIGSDPLSALPFGTARALAQKPLIAIDPRRSLTTDAAKVVIPSAMYGLEAGGTAIRMDGVKIAFEPAFIKDPGLLSDEQILVRIKEAI